MGRTEWRRIAGLRVIMSWPDSGYVPQPTRLWSLRSLTAGMISALLIIGGATAIGVAVGAQKHAPQPSPAAAGATGASADGDRGPSLQRSLPVSVDIPAIGVSSGLLHLGATADGAMRVPSLPGQAGKAAWYEHSVTPGEIGASVIEGHVDSYQGPAVFFRLGALRPGDKVEVSRTDGITAVFRVTGVRRYPKASFPAAAVYRASHYAALRLITCGGAFDYATGQYLSSVVVFASLASSHRTA